MGGLVKSQALNGSLHSEASGNLLHLDFFKTPIHQAVLSLEYICQYSTINTFHYQNFQLFFFASSANLSASSFAALLAFRFA
jgi:hypothetical protein